MKVSLFFLIFVMILFACRNSTGNDAIPQELQSLNEAIQIGEKLLANSVQGNGEGQYPAQAFTECQSVLNEAKNFLKDAGKNAMASQIDSLADVVYDALTVFESRVNSNLRELIDDRATKETRYLYHNLKQLSGNYMLFGMHDALGYGVGWKNMDTRSDVKDVCGDYPALFSWDAYYLFQTSEDELKHYTFRIKYAHEMGGVTTFCWHQFDPQGNGFYTENIKYNVVASLLPGGQYHDFYKNKLEKLAKYVKRLRGPDGTTIPVIFRPYHEQNGNWFWWGKGHRTEEQYVQLWRFTVSYLKDTLGVHSFIYAFSPDGNQFNAKNEYLIDYPGDDVVDVFGLDFYFGKGDEEEIRRFQSRVVWAVEHAQDRGKLAALTEVGDYYGFSGQEANLKIANWYTRCFLAPIKNHAQAKKIAYGAVWRNASKTHHFAPYPGHPSVPDFLEFFKDDFTIFLADLPPMFERP